MNFTEKRQFARVPLDAAARLVCGDRGWESHLLDVSLKGALIARPAEESPAQGTECRLELSLLESEVMIVMEGVIAHVGPEFIGFRCNQIDLASISHLRRLVELNLGDEGQLERELAELLAVRE